jgi:NitT/TauT family transport system ATP-binding protein
MMIGLVPPSQGQILVDGVEVKGPTRNVGIMFQTSALLPWRTVLDNVLLPIDMVRKSKREYRPRADELLELVGLSGFRDARPSELSGGMQQRVAMCRALIDDPPVVLLDEPFGALDHITREQLNDELLRIWRQTKKTIVLVTHAIDEAVYLSDTVVVMTARPGRVAAEMRIPLARPRSNETRTDPEFERCAVAIRRLLGVGVSGGAEAPSPS